MQELPALEKVEIEEGGIGEEEDLKERIAGVRRELACDLGIVLPPVRIKPDSTLPRESYQIKIKGVVVGKGKVKVGEYLALSKEKEEKKEIEGEETKDPVFSHPAKWIKPAKREEAEKAGYIVVDAVEIMATHLREVVKRYPDEFLGREEVKKLLDNIREEYKTVVDEVMSLLTLGELRRILINLVKEDVSIRNLPTILETLADNAPKSKDESFLTECVREALSRQICQKYQHNNTLHVLTLEPRIEESMKDEITLREDLMERLRDSLLEEVDKATKLGYHPVVLCSRKVRRHFKRLTSHIVPDLVVLSYEEIPPEVEVKTIGMVRI